MFESKNIYHYLFAFSLILVANYAVMKWKNTFEGSSDEEAKLIQKYLLNDSPLHGFNKPKIWIHTKYETNARKWKDFMSRNTDNLNMPYIHYTIQSVINHNNDDFHICLIDDNTFEKLIPNWNIKVSSLPDPQKTYFRELGMLNILYLYGGMAIPDSFLCMQNLKSFYDIGTNGKKPFVAEKVNQTQNTMEQKHKMLFIPDIYFMGALKNDSTIQEFIQYLETQHKKFDITEEKRFLGVNSQWCLQAIHSDKMNLIMGQQIGIKTAKRKTILVEELFEEKYLDLDRSCIGIYLPEDEILRRHKYQWFAYLSKEEILKTNAIVVKYLKASMVDANDIYRDTSIRSAITL